MLLPMGTTEQQVHHILLDHPQYHYYHNFITLTNMTEHNICLPLAPEKEACFCVFSLQLIIMILIFLTFLDSEMKQISLMPK